MVFGSEVVTGRKPKTYPQLMPGGNDYGELKTAQRRVVDRKPFAGPPLRRR